MKFVHLYAVWMIGLFAARLFGIISKSVFEALVILGIALYAAETYRRLCEFHYDRHREKALIP